MNLQKEFVPYQEALELKELGFDEPCFGSWETEHVKVPTYTHSISEFYTNSNHPRGKTTAPTYSQAFRWFRDNGYEAFPKKTENNEYYYTIEYGHWTFIMDDKYYSYEEAELACLKQLIRMLKSNNDSRK